MAGSERTRASSLAEDSAVSFAHQMDNYVTNSAIFKEVIASALKSAIQEALKPLQAEIASLQTQVLSLKSKLAKVQDKVNDNEQYSR